MTYKKKKNKVQKACFRKFSKTERSNAQRYELPIQKLKNNNGSKFKNRLAKQWII